MDIDPEQAEQVLTRHFAGSPAPGGGRVVSVFLWTLDTVLISRDEPLDLLVVYLDRGGVRVRERNPRWFPKLSPGDLFRLTEAHRIKT